jgi:hypothetical protein
MSKNDNTTSKDKAKKKLRTKIERTISEALMEWRGRIKEDKFQKIVRRAAKTLSKELVSTGKRIDLAPADSKTERRLAAANN